MPDQGGFRTGRSGVRHRHGTRRWLAIGAASIIALATAGVVVRMFARRSMSPCAREIQYGDRRRGVEICRAAFDRTGDERELFWAAKGYMYLGDAGEADKLARKLLAGALSGEAHNILSYLALQRGLFDQASAHANIALAAHTQSGDDRGRMSDLFLLSGAARGAGDLRAALALADESLRLARRLGDTHTEVVVSLQRADALRRLGDLPGAADTLSKAVAQATQPCDRAWAHLKSGLCRIEAGQDTLAMVDLTAAAQANRDCASPDLSAAVSINEAWLLRRTDPTGALARLDALSQARGEELETLLLRGYISADRGDLAAAERYVAGAAQLAPPDADWPWVIERNRGELREARGGLLGDLFAELHYRRAIAMIAELRSSARAHAAFFVSTHRSSYDDLIALLGRQGRWRDVLSLVLELDASDMLRATAEEATIKERSSLDREGSPSIAIRSTSSAIDDLVSAWRSRDLVIVVAPSRRQIGSGHERAYRLRVANGQVIGTDVGDAAAARAWADELFADPGAADAARALGRLIVPADPADGVLDVLGIGPLGKIPLAALRDDDGALVVGKRPLARVLALRATGPEAGGTGPPVIMADPTGDLSQAAEEGAAVAGVLGSRARIFGGGTPLRATRARLWEARDAELLHLAGHVRTLGRWRALALADGDVDPAEIVQQRLAPRLAVLAGCGSAAATDEEGWGSLAAALLEVGTRTVIATDRSVNDAAARSVMSEFYAQPDWRSEPARALARVQERLDARAVRTTDEATKPRLWAAFTVLRRPPVVRD